LSAKFSHCGNDNYEPPKFKVFQDSLPSNSKTFKAQNSIFKDFTGAAKMETLFKDF